MRLFPGIVDVVLHAPGQAPQAVHAVAQEVTQVLRARLEGVLRDLPAMVRQVVHVVGRVMHRGHGLLAAFPGRLLEPLRLVPCGFQLSPRGAAETLGCVLRVLAESVNPLLGGVRGPREEAAHGGAEVSQALLRGVLGGHQVLAGLVRRTLGGLLGAAHAQGRSAAELLGAVRGLPGGAKGGLSEQHCGAHGKRCTLGNGVARGLRGVGHRANRGTDGIPSGPGGILSVGIVEVVLATTTGHRWQDWGGDAAYQACSRE
mmetsp:Transcript_79343/g.227598  ORF Transcript_79343/g.227598 Transcript_79343/m.227598 type:complete len:259 (+) Transcript_79343:290-1066(+)